MLKPINLKPILKSLIFLPLGLILFASGVVALDNVGAKINQVSSGVLIRVSGRHAPRSEIVVVDTGSLGPSGENKVVAAAIDKGNGVFDFTFRANVNQLSRLEIFAIDPAGVTRHLSVPQSGLINELLPPTLVVDPDVDLPDGVGVGGYSYPGSVLTISITGDNGFSQVDVVEAELDDGSWLNTFVNLEPGEYLVVAESSTGGLSSQSSVEVEVVVEAETVLKPIENLGDTVSKTVEQVVPEQLRKRAQDVAPQAKVVTNTVAPVVSAGLLTQLALIARDLMFVVTQTFISLMQYFGFWRKRQSWGIVYDSVTKQPVVLATVRLYSLGQGLKQKLIETDVTSKAGVFSFVPTKGQYVIKATKPGYKFPSILVSGKNDGEYAHVYHGESFDFEGGGKSLEVALPMDPANVEVGWRFKVVKFLRERIYIVTLVSLVIGWTMSLVAIIGGQGGINGFFFLFYTLVLVVKGWLAYRRGRSWGKVSDVHGKAMAGVQLDLIDPKFEVLVQRRVSDREGRYQFIVPEGVYVIRVSSVGVELVKGRGKKVYQGQEIVVSGDKPKLIALKVVVEKKG